MITTNTYVKLKESIIKEINTINLEKTRKMICYIYAIKYLILLVVIFYIQIYMLNYIKI